MTGLQDKREEAYLLGLRLRGRRVLVAGGGEMLAWLRADVPASR